MLDEEDLGRVVLRKEVLFYHQVLEEALDHSLQALYAINHCYFPSRKRTQIALENFKIKPEDCYNRLTKIVEQSVKSETMEASVNQLRSLIEEIRLLGELGEQIYK